VVAVAEVVRVVVVDAISSLPVVLWAVRSRLRCRVFSPLSKSG
jgi:hypothetical protein